MPVENNAYGLSQLKLNQISLKIVLNMSDGRILKPDKDFSKEADKQIQEARELANVTFLPIGWSNAHC